MQEGEYGKARLWGAVGWGLFSPLSGVITSKLGSAASFDANLIGGVLALLPTVLLPTQVMRLGHGAFKRSRWKMRTSANGYSPTI